MSNGREYLFSEDEKFMAKLKALYTIEDDRVYRRRGRTYAMARIFVELAAETGRTINLHDHHISRSAERGAKDNLYGEIKYYIHNNPEYRNMKHILDHRSGTLKFSRRCYAPGRIITYWPETINNHDNSLLLIC